MKQGIMKLRNKKTGELGELQITQKHIVVTVGNGTSEVSIAIYNSLNELNKEWEDCTIQEPLIKDEKIRKAVRAWADVLNIMYADVEHDGENCRFYSGFCDLSIEFDVTMVNLEDGKYTISELCGE